MKYFIYFLGIIGILGTALPIIDTGTWWIRIFDFPRFQISIICLTGFFLGLFFLNENRKLKVSFLFLLLAAIVYQGKMIIGFTPLMPPSAKNATIMDEEKQFSLLMSNVRMANEKFDLLLDLIDSLNPDLILLTEPDLRWTKALIDLDEIYPHSIKEPLDNTYGMIFLSKFPLKESEVNFLVKQDIPSIYSKIILPSGEHFDFFGVHPEPPKPGTDTYERDTELLLIGKDIKENPRPVIVAGDLNDVGWSETSNLFREYSQLADPREGRGFYNTYSVFLPLLRYPLDHVFYSNDFGLVEMVKLEAIGSDHYPILITLTFEPDPSDLEEVDNTDAEENEEVEEKIKEGNEEGI